MKKTKIITMLFIIITFIVITIPMVSATTINPTAYKPSGFTSADTSDLANKFGIIVSALRTVGVVVTVVSLMVIGIKYMTGSVEEKADYKKTMIPYLIGVTLFFALTVILSVVISLAGNIDV